MYIYIYINLYVYIYTSECGAQICHRGFFMKRLRFHALKGLWALGGPQPIPSILKHPGLCLMAWASVAGLWGSGGPADSLHSKAFWPLPNGLGSSCRPLGLGKAPANSSHSTPFWPPPSGPGSCCWPLGFCGAPTTSMCFCASVIYRVHAF